jgi:hypothetical protein
MSSASPARTRVPSTSGRQPDSDVVSHFRTSSDGQRARSAGTPDAWSAWPCVTSTRARARPSSACAIASTCSGAPTPASISVGSSPSSSQVLLPSPVSGPGFPARSSCGPVCGVTRLRPHSAQKWETLVPGPRVQEDTLGGNVTGEHTGLAMNERHPGFGRREDRYGSNGAGNDLSELCETFHKLSRLHCTFRGTLQRFNACRTRPAAGRTVTTHLKSRQTR